MPSTTKSGRVCVRAAAVTLVLAVAFGPNTQAGRLDPRLERAIEDAGPGSLHEAVVMMREAPSTLWSGDRRREIEGLPRTERRARVVELARSFADETQAPVRQILGSSPDAVLASRVLLGVNGLAIEATGEVLRQVAALPDVEVVFPDPEVVLAHVVDVDPTPGASDPETPTTSLSPAPLGEDASVSGPTPGARIAEELRKMRASDVWLDLGYTGEGAVVAVIDGGSDIDHPDLADHLWVNEGELPGNGIDDDGNGKVDDVHAWNFCRESPTPSKDIHGTQAAGAVAGDGTSGTIVGTAPGASLMALDVGCARISDWWRASDYAVAEGADVISQSLSLKYSSSPDYGAFRRQTDFEHAAGVLHVNSAGNTALDADKPVPRNLGTPADAPPPAPRPDQRSVAGASSVLAIGNVAVDRDALVPSSASGPSAWEDIRATMDPTYPHEMPEAYRDYPYANGSAEGLLKPDLLAYGNHTVSLCPRDRYCGFSGTSAAAPHAAGVAALMFSSNPEASPEEIARALYATARPLAIPNGPHRDGAGLIDALEATRRVERIFDVVRVRILDDGYGPSDADGVLDAGESAGLEIALVNRSRASAGPVSASLRLAAGPATVERDRAGYPVSSAGDTIEPDDPFVVRTASGACGADPVVFVMDLMFDGRSQRARVEIPIGTLETVLLLDDGFETDGDWESISTAASAGAFVRGVPVGAFSDDGTQVAPSEDVDVDGSACWVTGNEPYAPGRDVHDDVDAGSVRLSSPAFGVNDLVAAKLVYSRWFFSRDTTERDHFRVDATSDGGDSWMPVELLTTGEGGWERATVDLGAAIPLSDDMRLRFWVQDGGLDTLVEGGIDRVEVEGTRLDCQDFGER